MKQTIIILATVLCSISAFAEGPILACTATRLGPTTNGKPGFEMIDKAEISTVIDEKIEITQLKGAKISTFISGEGMYILVIQDEQLKISSSTSGTVDNQNINLGLSGQGISNFIKCEIH